MRLFVFGLGYTSLAFLRHYKVHFSSVAGTVRSGDKARRLAGEGIEARVFDGNDPDPRIAADIQRATLLLASAPPGPTGDPALAHFAEDIAAAPDLTWIGYLSTVGVYGDRGGEWVDETAQPLPISRRSRERLEAERQWLDLGRRSGKAVHVFRLAGIYGPGRSALDRLADGTPNSVVKAGQVFNRIHVADIATVLMASIERPRRGAIYNVADDDPAPPQDVIAFAASLLGIDPPQQVPFAEADLTPMAASFYAENKRVSNRLIKQELGVDLAYPTYREGLSALHTSTGP